MPYLRTANPWCKSKTLHHIIKLYAIIRNSVDKYKLLIIFVIYQYISDSQQFASIPKIAYFKYCPGHQKPR